MTVTYRYDRMNRLEREHYRDGTVDSAETCRYNERNELIARYAPFIWRKYHANCDAHLP